MVGLVGDGERVDEADEEGMGEGEGREGERGDEEAEVEVEETMGNEVRDILKDTLDFDRSG